MNEFKQIVEKEKENNHFVFFRQVTKNTAPVVQWSLM